MPRHKVALWADYDLSGLGLDGRTLGAGVRYSSAQNIPGYDEDVPGRALVDAMARYRLGALEPSLEGLELKVNVENLFDKEYVTCVADTGCRYGAPLSIFGTVTYRW